jgi:hypothetical protein
MLLNNMLNNKNYNLLNKNINKYFFNLPFLVW